MPHHQEEGPNQTSGGAARGQRQGVQNYAEKVCELQTENYQITLALQRQEKEMEAAQHLSKQQFEEMVARYEAGKKNCLKPDQPGIEAGG